MRQPRSQHLAVYMAAGALLVLLLNAVILWQLLDEVKSDGGRSEEPELPAELPPPSGSGRSLIRGLEGSFARINRPLRDMRDELESANLSSLPPLLADLSENTSALPEFEQRLEELTGPNGPLNGLEGTLGGVADGLRPLQSMTGSLATLNSGMGRVERSLGDATGVIDETGGTLRDTNGTIREMLPLLRELATAMREAKASLDQTNRCLERPIICQRSR